MIEVPSQEDLAVVNSRLAKLESAVSALTPIPTPNVYDKFDYTFTFPNGGTSPNGLWKNEYLSKGYAKVENGTMILRPGGVELNQNEGSVLVRSVRKFGNFRATYYVTTEEQTYPNPPGWQSAWTIFRHLDKWRHWYIIIGLDHLEIGKKDAPINLTNQADIEKYQYTLWTGGLGTPLKTKRKVTIEFIGNVLKVWLDDKLQTTLVDDGRLVNQRNIAVKQSAWSNGEFCPYVEGAKGVFYPMAIETL
jgi:hypothetical protein